MGLLSVCESTDRELLSHSLTRSLTHLLRVCLAHFLTMGVQNEKSALLKSLDDGDGCNTSVVHSLSLSNLVFLSLSLCVCILTHSRTSPAPALDTRSITRCSHVHLFFPLTSRASPSAASPSSLSPTSPTLAFNRMVSTTGSRCPRSRSSALPLVVHQTN